MILLNYGMPSECEYCPLCRYYPENGNVWCNALNRLLKRKWNADTDYLNVPKPDNCPLTELVMCKDCENWDTNNFIEKDVACLCGNFDSYMYYNNFCSGGEPKKQDGDVE